MLQQLDSGTLTLLYLMPLRSAHAGEHHTGWINVSVFFFSWGLSPFSYKRTYLL